MLLLEFSAGTFVKHRKIFKEKRNITENSKEDNKVD